MLDNELENNLNEIFKLAQSKHHEFITVEHLLLSLLANSKAVNVLKACEVDLELLKKDLEDFIDKTSPILDKESKKEIQPTLGFQRVLQRAVFHIQSSGIKEVKGSNVLVAIFSEKESQSVFFLEQQGMTRLDAVSYMSHGNLEDDIESILPLQGINKNQKSLNQH